MKGLEFPIIGTKSGGVTQKFDLTKPAARKKYFQAKAGDEIVQIKKFLSTGNFMAFLLGKKNSGKSTYVKLFMEIFGEDKIEFISVGDVVREVHTNWDTFSKSPDFAKLKGFYRGYISFEDAVEAFLGRTTAKLLPTEFIMALLKLKISKLDIKGKSVFVDGLPREVDQVSYSLYFRDLSGFTDAKDMFILIDIPESVIDERIKYRAVCPICATSRNKKLLVTSTIEYKNGEFNLICDNPACKGAKMVRKEGDDKGIEPLRGRLVKDEEIIRMVFALHGMPKLLLRNHVPVAEAKKYFDEYELTPEYVLSWDEKSKKVMVTEKPWTVKDDNGVECYSLLAAPVLVTMLKQMVEVLKI